MNPLAFYIFSSAFGYTGLTFQINPFLVKKVYLPESDEKRLLRKMGLVDASAETPHPKAEQIAAMIRAYFEATPLITPWRLLDLQRFTPVQRQVYTAVARIPFGQVRSYGQIAARIGRNGAARFVGACMARNPYPILIPCHRVLRSDGSLGGFGGGLPLKQRMLELESGIHTCPVE